jgi:hypothetical protein
MKIFLVLILTCLTNISFAQKTTKHQDMQNLLSALQIKATMQNMVIKGIELYKKQKPAVPQQVWNEIKNSIEYTSYMNKVSGIFDNNYTQPEIKNLISLAAATKPKLPQFKTIVQQQLYNEGKVFGKYLGSFIQGQLQSKGYF